MDILLYFSSIKKDLQRQYHKLTFKNRYHKDLHNYWNLLIKYFPLKRQDLELCACYSE